MTDARYAFLPWLRPGLMTGAVASGGHSAARAVVRLGDGTKTADVDMQLRLYGPGDVTGVDPRQVIRTEPRPDTTEFEPNHIPAVEFDSPDLPWLLTPKAPEADRLPPWLCLVVVRADRATVRSVPGAPLPVLELADATGELPDLADSWAWAHAQVVIGDETLDTTLAGSPARTLSRLLAPRQLTQSTAYLACVVPCYEAGRRAGLGQDPGDGTEPAWTSPAAGAVRLPVYHHWSFSTGPAGDFAALVGRLAPRALAGSVGLREVDVSAPGLGLPAAGTSGTLHFGGALRSPAARPDAWPDPAGQQWRAGLATLLQPQKDAADTQLTPPLYGRLPAGLPQGAPDQSSPRWLAELNQDPRWRAAAGLGAAVVQELREQLIAAAWEQAGEVRAANALLHHGQLARAATERLFERRLRPLQPPALLRLTAPAHARIRTAPDRTLHATVEASIFPGAAVSAAFRRTVGPGGPVGRRLPAGAAGAAGVLGNLVGRLAAGTVTVPIADVPAGTVRLDDVSQQVGLADRVLARATEPTVAASAGWRRISDLYRDPPPPASATTRVMGAPAAIALPALPLQPPDDGGIDEIDPIRIERLHGMNLRFNVAARAHQAYLALPPAAPAAAVPAAPLPLNDIATALLGTAQSRGSLHPDLTVVQRVLPRIANPAPAPAGPAGPAADPLAGILVAPRFPQPMSIPLRDRFPDALLPGAAGVAPETVAQLVPDPAFVEAYLIGLNAELSRELRFHGYPIDQRSTSFRQFFDPRGRTDGTDASDIPPVAAWDPTRQLGGNATGAWTRDTLLVLVRGELIRRYPTVTISAVRAADRSTPGTERRYPLFRGRLGADILYFGLDLPVADAVGSSTGTGWFVVFTEQLTEARFALDAIPTGANRAANGADLARITLRQPMQAAIHAANLLTPEAR